MKKRERTAANIAMIFGMLAILKRLNRIKVKSFHKENV
jgi:hydroxypyruvate isomerase